MKRKNNFLLIACCIFVFQIPGAYAKDPTPEQLVAEHLKSIGEPDALAQIKSISFTGTAEVNLILGMHGNMSGTAMLVSQGPQMGINMRFQDLNYPGEHFAYDGKTVTVGHIQPGRRSPIADFLFHYNRIMRNGMLGGVFSNAWPLLDINGSRPGNMRVRKTKMGGTDMYELEYRPRDNHGDMRIRLYFDPATYRHLRTEYNVRMVGFGAALEGGDGGGNYILTERFEDFRKVGDLTLPFRYILEYSIDGVQGAGFLGHWRLNAQEIVFNAPDISPGFFKAE